MYLTIDVGNSSIDLALFNQEKTLMFVVNLSTKKVNELPKTLEKFADIKVAICSSVVPKINNILATSIKKVFDIDLIFLNYKMKTNVDFNRNFKESLGTDFIANASGATIFYPDQDIFLVAFGTATTFSVIHNNLLNIVGIAPGLRTSAKALIDNTAMLELANIKPVYKLGMHNRSPELTDCGIYFSQLGAVKEILSLAISEFELKEPKLIATGGGGQLFTNSHIFDLIEKDLAHFGLLNILEKNNLLGD